VRVKSGLKPKLEFETNFYTLQVNDSMKKSSDKKDRLERFVRDNRDGFDTFLPQDSLWNRIEQQIPAPGSVGTRRFGRTTGNLKSLLFDWRIAAGIFLAFCMGYLFFLNHQYGVTRDLGVAINAPAYAKEFNQYKLTIDGKRNEIIKLARNNPELSRDFAADLKGLELSYKNLKSDLGNAPNKEALVQAMIQNLQLQVELLNQQLNILQRFSNATKNHGNDQESVI
jgi:hypothetical protein